MTLSRGRTFFVAIAFVLPLLIPQHEVEAQLKFRVQPKPNSDTLIIQWGAIPMAIDLKLVRFESMSLLKYLGLKTLPATYSQETFGRDNSVHCVFAFPGALGLLDVYGYTDRGRPSFGFQVLRSETRQAIRECAPLAVSREGLMVTLTDSSIQLCLPDGRIFNDQQDLPPFFFEGTSCPIVSLQRDSSNRDEFYTVQIAFPQRQETSTPRQHSVLLCRYQVSDESIVIHQRSTGTQESLLSSDELQPDTRDP